MKAIEFWKDLCQKLCCLLNRNAFNSPTRKHRRNELVQDNLVILGSHMFVHHGGVHPKLTNDGELKIDFGFHIMIFCKTSFATFPVSAYINR